MLRTSSKTLIDACIVTQDYCFHPFANGVKVVKEGELLIVK
jgi:hypothetical protein